MNQEAQLTVLLSLKDQLSGGIRTAGGALRGLASETSMSGRALSTLGGGMSTLSHNVMGLVSSLGMVGLAGGLFAVTGLLKSSISEAETLGENVLELTKLTGESAESLSGLAGAMQSTGVNSDVAQKAIGMMDKMLGAMTTDKQAAFELQYGLSLKDTTVSATQLSGALAVLKDKKASHAQVAAAETLINKYNAASYKSTNDMILQAADYYNNDLVPAQDKADALAKMFGRSWQTLIPLFTQGADGIQALEQQAAAMGLTITTDNLPAIEKMKEANEKWNTSMSGLQLQIGLALLPALSDLADHAADFLTGHKADIVGFFKSAADFAGQLGDAITSYVLPALKAIGGVWASIPAPLQDLLIGGGILAKLTGIGAMDIAKIFTGGGGGVTSGASVLEGMKGQTPADPMWVAVVGGGGLGGGLGGVGAAAGAAAGVGEGEATIAGGLAIGGGVGLAGVGIGLAAIVTSAAVVSAAGDLVTKIAGPADYSPGQETTNTITGEKSWAIDPNENGGVQFTSFPPEDPRSPLHAQYLSQLQATASAQAQRAQLTPSASPEAIALSVASRWAGPAGVKADITGAKAQAAKDAQAAAAAVATRWAGPLGVVAQEQKDLKALQAQQVKLLQTGDVRLSSTLGQRIAALQQTIREQQANLTVNVSTTVAAGDVQRTVTRYNRFSTVVAE